MLTVLYVFPVLSFNHLKLSAFFSLLGLGKILYLDNIWRPVKFVFFYSFSVKLFVTIKSRKRDLSAGVYDYFAF